MAARSSNSEFWGDTCIQTMTGSFFTSALGKPVIQATAPPEDLGWCRGRPRARCQGRASYPVCPLCFESPDTTTDQLPHPLPGLSGASLVTADTTVLVLTGAILQGGCSFLPAPSWLLNSVTLSFDGPLVPLRSPLKFFVPPASSPLVPTLILTPGNRVALQTLWTSVAPSLYCQPRTLS